MTRTIKTANVIQWVFLTASSAIAIFVLLQISDFKKKADALAHELAMSNAQSLVLRNVMYADHDYFSDLQKSAKTVCDTARDPGLLTACRNLNPQWAAFLDAYGDATMLRVTAQGPQDFQKVEKAYRDAWGPLNTATGMTTGNDAWRALVAEGIAYALLQQADGNTKSDAFLAAEKESGSATEFSGKTSYRSAFVGITALKIACTRKQEAPAVAAQFATLKTALAEEQARVEKLPDATLGQRNANLELEYLRKDGELYYLCGYANLDPG